MLASTALHSKNQPALRNPAAFGCLGWTFPGPPVRRGNDSLDHFLIPPHSQRTVQYAYEHFPSCALYPRHLHPLATATDEISGLLQRSKSMSSYSFDQQHDTQVAERSIVSGSRSAVVEQARLSAIILPSLARAI